MKKYIYSFIVLIALIAIAGIMYGFNKTNNKSTKFNANDPNRPIVEVKESNFDLGKMLVKDTKEHDFLIKNSGQSDLTISRIATSCDCTYAYIIYGGQKSPKFTMQFNSGWETKIKPGDTATLKVVYQPSIMPIEGPVSRTVTVSTDDPQKPTLEFKISAEVSK